MSLIQYLCQLLSEELNELGQQASKLSRFGVDEIKPDQDLTNFERLMSEKVDVTVIYNLLLKAMGKADKYQSISMDLQLKKEMKLLKYSRYSVTCNQISENIYQELSDICIASDVWRSNSPSLTG